MAKIDEVKETLNTLRTLLSLLSAFLITVGGGLGVLFWIGVFFMTLFVIAGFVVITKIKHKTLEIGEL
jgi:type II secretory pathway component PulF